MLKEESLLKLKVVTLKKKLADQIQIRYSVTREDVNSFHILGYVYSREINWRHEYGMAALCEKDNEYFWVAATRNAKGHVVVRNRVVSTQIYLS